MKWNSKLYDDKHRFVSAYGNDLISLLDPQANEMILDLGCGTGDLAHEISKSHATVIGMDNSAPMISRAEEKFPEIAFRVASAKDFDFEERFDAIFSNAVLHWILDQEAVVSRIFKHLKSGGRFVAEFGGKGNVKSIFEAVAHAFKKQNIPSVGRMNFFYYGSIGEYGSLLEKHGFVVSFASHFYRATPLADGENGIAHWLAMFGEKFFHGLSEKEIQQVMADATAYLKSTHFHDGQFIADYQRLRIVAYKPEV